MPKNVGRYQQGGIINPKPDFQKDGGGEPSRPAPPAPAPKGPMIKRDNGNTVGNNDGHKAH